MEPGLGLLRLSAHLGLGPVEIANRLCTMYGRNLLKDSDCVSPSPPAGPGAAANP